MVDTIKFSEFTNGGDLSPDQTTVGLDNTLTVNTRFNNPFPLLAPGSTGDRPAIAPSMYYRLRFNTTTLAYEYYEPLSATWIELEDSASVLPLLASHAAGEGASLIGLQNQGGVNNKTVQDLANSHILATIDDGTLFNGVFLSALSTGFMASTTVTGALNTRVFTGTINQIDIANGDGSANPVFTLSSTLDLPGTFTIQGSTVIDEIINDDTMASALATNIPTALSVKNYVDAVATGLTMQGACYAGTTANLAGYTYNNGASGVGATLTAGSNGAFSTDGVSPALNARILVKNQSTTAQNGIYTLTTVGDGSTPAVLTRATDYDQVSEINAGDLVVITNGSTLASSSWLQTATVAVIGTDPIVFSQFTASLPITVPNGGTGLSSLNAYRILAGGTTSTGALQQIAAGTTGTLLQSQGASALAAYTTATYPSTVTANNILYASGTNAVGQLTPGTGVLTALGQNVTGTGGIVLNTAPTLTQVTFSTTSGIIGTTTNNSAASGSVGELISSVIPTASAVSISSATNTNLTSISLTAGDWDLWGNVTFTPTVAGALNSVFAWTSQTSATLPDSSLFAGVTIPGGQSQSGINAPRVRVSLSGTTTLYISGRCTISSGTCTMTGGIYARRTR